MQNYYGICENIFKEFIISGKVNTNYKKDIFTTDACPEPYLIFKNNNVTKSNGRQLVFITTNPGEADEYHLHSNITSNNEVYTPFNSKETYINNSKELAKYYEKNLIGTSKARINHMRYIAEELGYSEFIQIECIPFHSANLPEKKELNFIDNYVKTELKWYVDSLEKFIEDKDVIIISAAKPSDISDLTPWSSFQCDLVGINIKTAKDIALTMKENKVTGTSFITKNNNNIKAIILRMGANDVPNAENLKPFINEVKSLI